MCGLCFKPFCFLCSRVFPDKEAMMSAALELAGEMAGRSPVAVQGTKINLIYSRDHSVAESLEYMVRTSSLQLFLVFSCLFSLMKVVFGEKCVDAK